MKIELQHTEIEIALIDYIASQGIDLSDKHTEVTMIAGRGSNGHSAMININPVKSESVTALESVEETPKETTEPDDTTKLFA